LILNAASLIAATNRNLATAVKAQELPPQPF
jgi:hypothetical protein